MARWIPGEKKEVHIIYYYPNRPKLIPADSLNPMNPSSAVLDALEASGKYVAEQKWNGDNCYVYKDGAGKIELWNRHKARLQRTLSEGMREELKALKNNSILNAEYIGGKTINVKGLLIAHCIMMWDGSILLGKTWGDSRSILTSNFQSGEHLVVSALFREGFWKLFQTRKGLIHAVNGELLRTVEDKDSVLIEGVVLKDPTGKLVFSTKPVADVPFMLKIRHPSGRHNF